MERTRKNAIQTKFHYRWQEHPAKQSFATGVSLHGHTWHSLEGLAFLPGIAEKSHLLPPIMRWIEDRYRRKWNEEFNYELGYWTSPISPEVAYTLEAKQIEAHGFRPLVSITDHNDIAACEELVTFHNRNVPVSLEWTVPYKSAMFHVGVHNLPPEKSRAVLQELQDFTAHPDPAALRDILMRMDKMPEVLLVLNHPLVDQGRISFEVHESAVHDFLEKNGQWIHALEMNALQPLGVNRRVAAIAQEAALPLIAGGDRHGFEPNGAVNLTNARTFAEFVAEIRHEKKSDILFMPQCRGSLTIRYADSVKAILGHYPELVGRASWHDRVFYTCPDGVTRSLTEMLGNHEQILGATSLCFGVFGFVVDRFVKPLSPTFARAKSLIF